MRRETGYSQRPHSGTANTLTFSCFDNATERAAANAPLNEIGSGNSSNTAVGRSWAWRSIFVDTCYEKAREEGSLISTAFAARDLMQIVDALGEDGLLRYWGKLGSIEDIDTC